MQAVTITQITPIELETLIENSVNKVLVQQNTPPHHSQDERLTRREVCALYKISLPTVHKSMREGLPFEKLGRKTLFRREQVDSYFRNKRAELMKKHKDSPKVFLEGRRGKSNQFQSELRRVYNAFHGKPKTMKEVDKETGIMRESICWYCKELRRTDRLFPVGKRMCTVTKHSNVIEWTSNPNLIPSSDQLNLF